MSKLNHRSRTLLGAVIGAAVLVLPSTALADCASVVAKSAFKGAVVEYYPQACYSKALKSLGPDVNTYSPNVSRNLKSAMRRDRTRTLKFTIVWLAKNKVRVASNYKLKSSVQVRKGAKVLTKGSISSTDDDAETQEEHRQVHGRADLDARQEEDHRHQAVQLAKVVEQEAVVTVAASLRPRRCSSIGRPKAALSVSGRERRRDRPLRHGRALAHEERVRGAGRYVLDVMDDGHGRELGLVGRQPLERADHGLAAGQIEARGRLVEQEQRRLVHERAGDQHAPALALRQRGEALPLATGAAEALEQHQRALHDRPS